MNSTNTIKPNDSGVDIGNTNCKSIKQCKNMLCTLLLIKKNAIKTGIDQLRAMKRINKNTADILETRQLYLDKVNEFIESNVPKCLKYNLIWGRHMFMPDGLCRDTIIRNSVTQNEIDRKKEIISHYISVLGHINALINDNTMCVHRMNDEISKIDSLCNMAIKINEWDGRGCDALELIQHQIVLFIRIAVNTTFNIRVPHICDDKRSVNIYGQVKNLI